jgi:hypothetical protein
MNKVYYWCPLAMPFSIGHASLDISFGEGIGRAEYVSFWPDENHKGLEPASVYLHPYFTSDTADVAKPGAADRNMGGEGRQPTTAIEIYCLDENKMRAAWLAMKRDPGQYFLLTKNCASVVLDLLLIGGARLSATIRYMVSHLAGGPVIAPWLVRDVALLIVAEDKKIRRLIQDGWKEESDINLQIGAPPMF